MITTKTISRINRFFYRYKKAPIYTFPLRIRERGKVSPCSVIGLDLQNDGNRPLSIGNSKSARAAFTIPSMMSPGEDASAAGRLA